MNTRTLYSNEPARGWLPWGALAPVLGFVFVAAPLLLGSALLERAGLLDASGEPIGLVGLCALLLLPFGLLAAVVLGWVRMVERRPLATLGLAADGAVIGYARGLGLGFATVLLVVVVIWLAGGYRAEAWASAWLAPSTLPGIVALLLCFAVQAGAEELLFRGWLLSVLARKFNLALGVTISAALFCALHYSPGQAPLATLNIFLFAVFAAALAWRSQRLWLAMGWHAGWNWLLAVGFELPVTGLDAGVPALLVALEPTAAAWLSGGTQGPEGSIACTLFFVAASVVLFFGHRRPAAGLRAGGSDRRRPAN
jgi:uncharacterized protein